MLTRRGRGRDQQRDEPNGRSCWRNFWWRVPNPNVGGAFAFPQRFVRPNLLALLFPLVHVSARYLSDITTFLLTCVRPTVRPLALLLTEPSTKLLWDGRRMDYQRRLPNFCAGAWGHAGLTAWQGKQLPMFVDCCCKRVACYSKHSGVCIQACVVTSMFCFHFPIVFNLYCFVSVCLSVTTSIGAPIVDPMSR